MIIRKATADDIDAVEKLYDVYKKHGYTEIGIIPTDFNGISSIKLVLLEKYLGE